MKQIRGIWVKCSVRRASLRCTLSRAQGATLWVSSPLLELFGGDEPGPQIAVPHSFGLPPRGVVLRHHLQDVPPFEGKSRLLAGRGLVLQWGVVKQGSHVHL